MTRRWMLRATAWPDSPLSQSLASAINANPQRFWTRRGAANAIHFYADVLGLRVTYWVLDTRTP